MHITINHQIENLSEGLLIPIVKQASYENALASVSELTGLPLNLLKEDFKAEKKEIQTFYFQKENKTKRIFLLGLGEKPTSADIIDSFRSFIYKWKNKLAKNIGISFLQNNLSGNHFSMLEAAVNGTLLGCYEIGVYKTDKKNEEAFLSKDAILEIYVEKELEKEALKAIKKGKAVAETQLEIFNLVDAPSNKKTPQVLSKWAQDSGEKFGYDVKVLEKSQIEKIGLDALLAVNRGSEFPPTFIIMEYKPVEEGTYKKIGLVGKGVTFDTGGVSLKPSTNMHYMKSDMGGAAAVLGAMEICAKLQLPIHLIGIVPATDNSVDALSIKPSDVISSYSGKSIEIIDTDAEGRLILADGLAYMVKHYKPDVLIDLATLTGSCIRTLGDLAGGLFTQSDELAENILDASTVTGERLWRLPMWDDYKNYMKSDVADVKNFSGIPTAGAITAAKFLEIFTEEHPCWAHLDIAGVAVSSSEFSNQKSATAFGVRLLIEYLENIGKED